MHSRKTVPIIDLMNAANMELIRLDFKSSTLSRHSKEFRSFSDYCRENEITAYDTETGPQYFQHRYGFDIGDPTAKLTKQQLDTRCSIRFLDDIFQFGYALRYSHHDYTVPRQYVGLLEEYLAWCHRSNSSAGTIRVKRTKMRQFFCFLDGRGIELSDLTAAEISDFMTTLCRYHRATIHVFSSVLRDFFRYLHENGISDDDLSPNVPRPKIYVEENIPETWSPEEVRQLLSVIDRSNAIGKRDYAMLLLAILLGMRAGDICALKFKNLDWHQKLITYTQQKTQKVNTLPLLPVIGDAIIDYLKNGRLDSDCDNVFIRHIHPYGEFLAKLDKKCIEDFLLWLTKTRGSSPATYNQRLCAIHAFFDYVMTEEPAYMEQCILIFNIPSMVSPAPPAQYLTPEKLKHLLSMPDTSTSKGRRHLVLLNVLYDTAARVSELVDICMRDVRLDFPAVITLHGKGGKIRTVPLMKQTAELLRSYLAENHIDVQRNPDMPLFWNGSRHKLTRSGITYIVQKYADMARETDTGMPTKISPHVFRHTKAMHMVQANVNPIFIKDYLGHADISTTEVYARADNEAKRAALEKATAHLDLPKASHWEQDTELIEWLSSLG